MSVCSVTNIVGFVQETNKTKTIAKDTYLKIPKLAKLSLEWHSVILVALTVSLECDIFLSANFYSINFEGHSNIQTRYTGELSVRSGLFQGLISILHRC